MTAVIVTGIAHLVIATWLDRQLLFILAAGAAWIAFVAIRAHRDPTAPRAWGFTRLGSGRSLRLLLPFALLAVPATAGYGLLAGALRRHGRLPDGVIVVVTSLLFAAVHLPSIPLVVVAGLMGAITTPVYFRAGNLFALGIDPLAALLGSGLWP